MASFNRVIMVGNLTRDPELRQLPSGASVCRLGIASNRQFKDKNGSTTQEVCFIDVDVWGPQADACKQYLQKGRPILVEGRLKLDTWKDAEGQTRSKHSIVATTVQFLGGQDQAGSFGGTSEGFGDESDMNTRPASTGGISGKKLDELPFSEDLPF